MTSNLKFPEIISIGDQDRPGIVHRLDKGTSGIMVVAKSQRAYILLKKMILKRKIERLEKNLLGVQHLTKLPDAIFVVDTRYERIAIQEANKLNIPVIALVDSNNSFEGVDYMIPANDDAMSSIDLFMKSISNIILESKPKKVIDKTSNPKEQKKSIKAKKVLKAPEVKKVSLKSNTVKESSNKDEDKMTNE